MNGSPITQLNGRRTPNATKPPVDELYSAEAVQRQMRMRFNPLRTLSPETLSMALDRFEAGLLREAALLWEAMCKRDDTLSSVKPKRELSIANKDWQVLKIHGAPEPEASRHAATLEWFYDRITATNAFDRNIRGGSEKLIEQMMSAVSYAYAAHHIAWRPMPGRRVEVKGATPAPVISAEIEFVPLHFFENTIGRLRLVPDGGFGIEGIPLDWDGEWMCATGQGLMFAGSILYQFKRLSFHDWTIFNERYAQGKVVGRTAAAKGSEAGNAMLDLVSRFNGDMEAILYGDDGSIKDPLTILYPEGTGSIDAYERFLDRCDRKLATMFRGADLGTMSRDNQSTGVSAQTTETELLELADCRGIAGALNEGLDRHVIRFCYGDGVEPLAYIGLPEIQREDLQQTRESAGFLADRGVLLSAQNIAERLGFAIADQDEETLGASAPPQTAQPGDQTQPPADGPQRTPNAAAILRGAIDAVARRKNKQLIGTAKVEMAKAAVEDLAPFRARLAQIMGIEDAGAQEIELRRFRDQLPEFLKAINVRPRSAEVLAEAMAAGWFNGIAEAVAKRRGS